MDTDSTASSPQEGDKERAGIQSVEVGFALLDVLAQAPAPLMLRDLAAAVNTLLAAVHASVIEQRRFISDAAHQLRTPLAAAPTSGPYKAVAPPKITIRITSPDVVQKNTVGSTKPNSEA